MRVLPVLRTAALAVALVSCTSRTDTSGTDMTHDIPPLEERIAAFAPVDIRVDLSALSDRERDMIRSLIDAAKIADEIFWKQTAPDAVAIRDSLAGEQSPEARMLYAYVLINYGAYDRIFEGARFVGSGPGVRPPVGAFYPLDVTKEEFTAYVTAHPAQRAALESPYTVVRRTASGLEAVPYHAAYPEVERLAKKLEEAASYCDNPSLKRYLRLRAAAVRTDDYYESDLAWMDLRDNAVDVVIGPIENYEDALFNYKTAYEAAVMVKDVQGTKELEMFLEHIDAFERALPQDAKYIRPSAGSGNILEIVNIVYFAGDFQKGVKTIAASLPNDPRVTDVRGGKKQMYRNMMEAKFDNIVVPIASRILDPALVGLVDRSAFTSFVTLHEVSHTLGRATVYGRDSLTVRKSLQERYSAIEECKADVLGLYNLLTLQREGLVTQEQLKKSMVTYVAGLFRSLRFGAEEAHGRANLVQLNWLRSKGAITRSAAGTYGIDETSFMRVLGELGREVLTLQAEGDYTRAGRLLDKYGVMTDEIREAVARLKDVPRDLDTRYLL